MNPAPKILLVDDEEDLVRDLEAFLEEEGYEVLTALDGETALKKIEEMKRINQKGGDSAGFKYIIPKSAKKLASRMAGDVDITLEDRKTATNSKLLPQQSSVGGTDESGENINDVGGLNDDDRPMRKKKPREAKELKDFYTFQKWKSWTKNAENFLSRGKLSRKVFDNKRKFRSV